LLKKEMNMKRISAGLLASVLSLSSCAQTTDIKPSDNPKTLLWKVSGNGLSKPSYLFGTIHAICAEDGVLSSNMKKIIRNADDVYFELDLDNMMEMLMGAAKMQMNGDTTLKDLLSPEDYIKVKNYYEEKSSLLPFSMIERLKPFMATATIQEGNMPCENPAAMEQIIMEEAKASEKEIRGLESVAYQVGVLDSIPYKLQAEQLVEFINNSGKGDNSAEMKEMMKAYKEQDLSKLEQMIVRSDVSISSYTDILLYNRNRNWVKKLKTIMPGKTLLIAVGAGHLPGDQGVINLLRKEGYKVEPIENKTANAREI
jgi:uncharacterized protein YbaP (TraB family)